MTKKNGATSYCSTVLHEFLWIICDNNLTFFITLTPRLHLKARAIFLHSGQIAVPHYPGIGVICLQSFQQFLQGFLLLGCPCIGRGTLGIQSAFVADTDGTAVVPLGMGTLRVEGPAGMHYPVASDVVVVADVGKAPVTVVATAVVHGIATGATGGTTMYHYQFNGAVLLVLATV